jgi:hypothetical protein
LESRLRGKLNDHAYIHPVVHREILDGSGQPAFDVFCFAYSYADEHGAAAASLEGEAETLSEAHHPEERRPYLPPDSEERVMPPDL